eukprot:TRINITY_DN26135_c0_g1_i1.p1 TRINITY_DN26135_c0_g1~~TRINITY_DN26135_c0_g1_i1.p1  ORF type:complete len:310 (+),score=65.95 TRINITY_DN26135_c0_g1_i1:131-931(+)
MITQVQRPDIDYEGGISARRHYNGTGQYDESGEEEDEYEAAPSQQPQAAAAQGTPCWKKFLCCCFGGGESGAPGKGEEHAANALLPPLTSDMADRKCLVLDLDETLVHSSFKPIANADFIIPVEIEEHVHQVYVLKRPEVDKFMEEMGKIYEVVVFTASLSKYADPVLDLLDKHQVVRHRLFREHCHNHKGTYVKDLSQMGRELKNTIIIDNSPASYLFHPENAVPIESWFDDPADRDLLELIPFLQECARAPDVRVPLRDRYHVT